MSLLVPQRWKYRKLHVKPISGTASRGTTVAFGEVGMKSLDNGYVTNRELEAMRKVLIRSIKKIGKIRFRVFPDVPFTKKGLEQPMGKGKGDVDMYTARIKKGKVIVEMSGVDRAQAEELFAKAGKKLSIRVKTVGKGELR